jgi:hypothetical protein
LKILALVYVYYLLGWQIIAPKDPDTNYFQLDCRIYDETSTLVATFPGFYCAFASNGEWLSLEEDTLKIYDTRNQLKYNFPFFVHHELRFSRDETKIYFLSSVSKMFKGILTRFDVINVSDRNGNLLYKWDTSEHINELINTLKLDQLVHAMPFPVIRSRQNLKFEFSHLNAIQEIPPNPYELILPYMKRGNLLVTFNGLGGFIIFDPELSKIEHIFGRELGVDYYGFHDAQILSNGHLIFYKNLNGINENNFSSLEEFDVLLEKKYWNYKLKSPEFAVNKINGSVQILNNNHVFISDNSFGGRAVELKRNGELVWSKYNERKDDQTHLPVMIYRAKKIAADKFFLNNITGATLK